MTERNGVFSDHARRYGELSWALVRCEGKVPKGKDWQTTRPDLDPEYAAGAWAEWGKRWNMGVVLGPSKVAVVEYDSEEGGRKLLELFGGSPPPTPTCLTGSDRLHFYFLEPTGAEKAVRDGIELRLGQHQCVAPPSVHPETGKPYRWIEGREPWALPLAEIPRAVLNFFAETHRNGSAPPVPDLIPIGEIDTTLASLAGSMRRRNASEDAIYAALVATLKRCEEGHTHTQDDCRRIAKSVGRYLVEQRCPAVQERRPEESASHSWSVRDLVAAQATPTAPPELLGLFYVSKNHLLSGETESAKTWLALAAAVGELAAGHGVTWVDGDDVGEGDLLERLRCLGARDDTISRLFAYVQPDEPLGEDQRAELVEHMKTINCRLVVIDGFNPLLVLHGLDPNSGSDVERFYQLIAPFKRSGAAVLLTDNVVKAKEARGAWAIGSERKKSKAEVHLGLRAVERFSRGHNGKSKIDVHKDRPGHLERPSPGMFVLESGADGRCTWQIRPDDSVSFEGDFRPTGLMEKVSRYLELRQEPVSRNQVVTDVTGKAEFVRVAIDRLVSEGYAEEHAGANRARLVQLVQAYCEGAEEEEF